MLHEYDPRDLQRKALERWEKQQQTWSKIEQRLQTQRLFSQSHHVHTNNNNNNNSNCTLNKEEREKEEYYYLQNKKKVSPQEQEVGPKDQSHDARYMMNTCNNKNNKKNSSTILHAPTEDRKKREANQIICMANNPTNFTGNVAWEDTLRRSSKDVSSMRRSVPIGKTTYPYVLYGLVSNNNNINDNSVDRQSDLAFTRIIHSDEVSNGEVEDNDCKNSVSITEGNHGNTFPQPSSKTSRVREKLQKQLTSNYVADEYKDVERKAESYIAQHARSLTPSVKKQIAHLTKPRHFLQVVGHATPVKTEVSSSSVVKNKTEELNQKYEEQQQQSAVQPQMEWMQSVPLQAPSLAHKDEENLINDINNNNEHTSADASNVPFLSLSSRRLTFYAKPLQLVHQTLEIENTSSVTVYYTMTPIDTWQEIIEEEEQHQEEKEGEKAKEQESSKKELLIDKERENLLLQEHIYVEDKNNAAVSSLSPKHAVTGTLHKLATHHAQCINFFYLSNESNGVMYPMSSVQFAFSLRSPRAGRFRQTYELLTVPASSTRILIELIGMVQHEEAPLCVLTSPIHDALEHKAVVNEQKQMVRGVINAHDPYEAAELESAIMAIHTATEEKEKAQKAVVAQHRQQWDEANALNMCDIPFNCQVYDAFTSLHDHVCTTLSELSCPLPCNAWNGSISQLIGLLSMLRDNALRELLHDGVMVLLRASRVSLHEDEPLQLLLHRAAVVCVLEEERRGVLAHSNNVLDWQAECEDDVLCKLEVLHNNDDGGVTINTTTQVNANNKNSINTRKSRSISPPSVSIPNNSLNNNNMKSTRSNNLSERNANHSNLVTQTTTTVSSTSSRMANKNSQGRKAKEQVGSFNDDNDKLANEEDNINVSFLGNDTNDVVVVDDNVLGLKQEYEIFMKEYIYTQIQTREGKIHDLHRSFCSLVEMCCSLPLLHVVHAARADDIARIQSAKEIQVDTSNPAFTTSSMTGISANGTTMLADGINAKSSANINSSGNTNNNSARTSKKR